MKQLDSQRSLTERLHWLESVVREDAWQLKARAYDVPPGEFRLARIDLAGVRALEQLVSSWRRAVDELDAGDSRLPPGEFAVLLRNQLDTEVALPTERRAGVNPLESLAAA